MSLHQEELDLDRGTPSHENPLPLRNNSKRPDRLAYPAPDTISLMSLAKLTSGDDRNLKDVTRLVKYDTFVEGNLAERIPDHLLDLGLSQRNPLQDTKTGFKRSGDDDLLPCAF